IYVSSGTRVANTGCCTERTSAAGPGVQVGGIIPEGAFSPGRGDSSEANVPLPSPAAIVGTRVASVVSSAPHAVSIKMKDKNRQVICIARKALPPQNIMRQINNSIVAD